MLHWECPLTRTSYLSTVTQYYGQHPSSFTVQPSPFIGKYIQCSLIMLLMCMIHSKASTYPSSWNVRSKPYCLKDTNKTSLKHGRIWQKQQKEGHHGAHRGRGSHTSLTSSRGSNIQTDKMPLGYKWTIIGMLMKTKRTTKFWTYWHQVMVVIAPHDQTAG